MIDPMAPSHLSFVLTSAGPALGLVAQLGGWAAATAVALLPLAYTVLRSLISGKAGVDFLNKEEIPRAGLAGLVGFHRLREPGPAVLLVSGPGEPRACRNGDSARYWPASQDGSEGNRRS